MSKKIIAFALAAVFTVSLIGFASPARAATLDLEAIATQIQIIQKKIQELAILISQYLANQGITTATTTTTTTTTTVAPTEGYFTYKVLATPPNNTSVYKGDSGKAVFGFSLKAQNSPMTVERVKFNFNKRPWLYFSNLYLYQGDTLLKQVEANSSAFEEVTAGSSYNLYITGLNVAIDKDVTKEFTLKVDMPSAISGTATSMTIQMAANAVRGLDAAGLNEYAPSSAKSRTIQIASATTGALEGSINSSTPAEGTAIVSTTDTTTDVPLLVFDLKAKNRDVTVNTIQVDISGTASNGLATVIPAVKLYDGNTLLDSETGTSTVTFGGTTALGLDITKDATKTLTVKVDVAKLATGYTVAGDHVAATVDTSNVTAEDSLYNTVSDLTGTATGHDIYFYNVAPTFTYVSKEVSVTGTDSQTHPQDTGNVSITFSVKANNGAIYIPTPSTLSTGIEETLTGTSSAVAAIGQITFTATPTADGVATATIDGTSVGYSYSTTTSDTAETVANGLAAAINANSTIYAEVHAATTSDDDGIINLTAATAGYAGNSITYSATTTASTGITASPTTATAMTGGLNTQSTSTTWSCESPADDTTASGYWYIPSGSTANCTFKDVVTNTSATAGWFKDTISSISWNTSNSLTNKIDQDWGLTNLNSGDFYLGI